MRRRAAPGKQNLHWASSWPCNGDDALETHRAQSGLDPPQGGKQTLCMLLAAAVYRISSLNPSWHLLQNQIPQTVVCWKGHLAVLSEN